ncbi:MAG: hypothetical protein GF307_04145 [candidate division Zixibacteria bacterium]|nr:hypothetical protein [candidate division Zixibacteria bacterium]
MKRILRDTTLFLFFTLLIFPENLFAEPFLNFPNRTNDGFVNSQSSKKGSKRRGKRRKPRIKLELNARMDITYDDNVVNYSDSDLDLYDSGGKDQKFEIESKDDIILTPRANFTMIRNRQGGLKCYLDGLIIFHFYSQNDIKNYQYYRLRFTREISRQLEAYVQVAYIPDYYYRNQWDPDVNEYFEAEFSKFYLYGGIDIEPFSHLTVSTDINYDTKKFNDRFDHLDSRKLVFEFMAVERFSYFYKAWGQYRFGYNRAEGEDDPDPDKKDTSYDLIGFTFGSRFYLSKITEDVIQVAVTVSYDRLLYQTAKVNDIYRFGRKDNNYEFSIAPRYYYKNWRFEIEYLYQAKRTDIGAGDDIKELLEYDSNEIKLSVRYSIL